MFNPIFEVNVQGGKHPGRRAIAKPELLCKREPRREVQIKKYGHKNSNNSHNYHDEI